MTREQLLRSPEYWIVDIQTKLYEALQSYQQQNGYNRTQLAEALGYSKGYISQILNGNFDHRMSKLVELSLKWASFPNCILKRLQKKKSNRFQKVGVKGKYPFQWLRRPAKSAGGDTSIADPKKMLGTSADAPACRQCGNITMRNGTCYMCPNCGTTTGCS